MRKTGSAAVLAALGAALCLLLLRQPLSPAYPYALVFMLLGLLLTVRESLAEAPAAK